MTLDVGFLGYGFMGKAHANALARLPVFFPDAARDSDAIAATAFNYRYLPAVQLAKRLVEEGELGDIYRFKGRYLQDWLADPEAPWNWRCDEKIAGSGVVGDVGSHTIDLARWIVGDIERVRGSLTTQITQRPTPDGDGTREVTTYDEYSALVEFENGADGVLEGSRVATGRKADNSIEIYGSEGALELSLRRLNELKFRGADDREYQQLLVTEPDDPYMDAWWPTGHIIGWEHAFVHEHYEFLRCIDEGTPYRPDFEDGLAAQRVVDAVQTSSESRSWVSV